MYRNGALAILSAKGIEDGLGIELEHLSVCPRAKCREVSEGLMLLRYRYLAGWWSIKEMNVVEKVIMGEATSDNGNDKTPIVIST